MTWKHNTSDGSGISLHDCRATHAYIENGALVLEFENGFWMTADSRFNPYGVTCRTDTSQLRICKFDIQDIYLFDEIRLLRRHIGTLRKSIPIEKLLENINCGKWQLEFLYEYHAWRRVLFECMIWFDKRPYSKACQLSVCCDEMRYFWNRICEDKTW
ncbi:MAG: hypothetical protein IJ512_04680 [Ruminococcus sp.]|nr:hypothetical protein [Ruminococcus sp.]